MSLHETTTADLPTPLASLAGNCPLVEVVDYGGGNLGSLLRALGRLSVPYQLVDGRSVQPSGAHPLILPGVGAFGALMHSLHERGLVEPIRGLTAAGTPLLGVCVGLQVLFEGSDESPGVAGLGLLSGQVVKLRANKVPQIGWNGVEACQSGWPEGYVYYVNSYVAQPTDPSVVLYASEYENERFCGAIRQGHVTAFQFHPEKSGAFGQQVLAHWLTTLGA